MRSVIAMLLLPALLTPSAGFGHSHGGNEPAGHASRPHVHLHVEGDHGHSHHCAGHRRPHSHDQASRTSDAKGAAVHVSESADHDRDAVYVDGLPYAPRADDKSGTDDGKVGLPDYQAAAGVWVYGRQLHCLLPQPPPWHTAVSCPLFVKHLALLI